MKRDKGRPLEKWIEVANILEPGAELADPNALDVDGADQTMLRKVWREATKKGPEGLSSVKQEVDQLEQELIHQRLPELSTAHSKEQLEHALTRRSEEDVARALELSSEERRRMLLVRMYRIFYSVRRAFESLVPRDDVQNARRRRIYLPPPATDTLIEVNQDATIGLGPDHYRDFLNDLTSSGDISRIRRCPICRKFYWAWRKDKGACSKGCLNNNRQRNHRLRQGKYEANRRRYRKEKIPARNLINLSSSLRAPDGSRKSKDQEPGPSI